MSFQSHAAIPQYHATLQKLKAQGHITEGQTRRVFGRLLERISDERGYTFVEDFPVGEKLKKRIDGAIKDGFSAIGYWEAKDENDILEKEIQKKIAIHYPISNTIFEDTQHAILWQNQKQVGKFDLSKTEEVGELLDRFFDYTAADAKGFADAVARFVAEIPNLARALEAKIEGERANPLFKTAFDKFFATCQSALNPQIKAEAVEEMIVQHLLTERLFKRVFDDEKWFANNIIARELEEVIGALGAGKWNPADYLKPLDGFFKDVEDRARTLPDYASKQDFLNTVYEEFLKSYSPDTADTMGIVYTPQPIVDWMCASVEAVLQSEFGQKLSTPGVQILDPCTGTGNFLVNILRRIAAESPALLPAKFVGTKDANGNRAPELWANEIMLLPYYVASGNLEHEYFDLCGQRAAFEGLCFQDTLDLAHSAQIGMFAPQNSQRIEAQNKAEMVVIIGNPPYNVGQKNENDNNKNRAYKGKKNEPGVDDLIKASYAKDSRATNKNSLYDPYVRFFKWASERLKGRDGVICFVSNNSFLDQHAFDGMRKHLGDEFNHIWHLDLHGNVRRNPKLSGTTHNAMGIQVGVGITVLVKNSASSERFVKYHRVPEYARKIEKLKWLDETQDVNGVEWQTLTPNAKNAWLTEGLVEDFESLMPMGSKEAKASFSPDSKTIFKSYGGGLKTNRDGWVYDFNRDNLENKMAGFVDFYNSEVERWKLSDRKTSLDDFVSDDDRKIKWDSTLKNHIAGLKKATFDEKHIRPAIYRPFTKQSVYFDRLLNNSQHLLARFFPVVETKNLVIIVPGPGNRQNFGCFLTDCIPPLDFAFEKTQCFPLYTYSPDGSERFDNITGFALDTARAVYGEATTREDVFYATYALLHHPAYRARYGENLKRELPRLPLGSDGTAPAQWSELVRIGRALGDLHVGYEAAAPHPLTHHNTTPKGVPFSLRVEKMRFNKEKTQLRINDCLTLGGFTPEMFSYKLGNRSALDWVVESYRVKDDARSGLTSDPNRDAEPNFILDLVGKVATVSLETQNLVAELPVLFGPVTTP